VTAFKLPLAASYNSRVGATNTADSTGYVGSGYVGVMLVGKSTQATDKDARFINCFKQTVKDADGRARVYTVKRAGFGTQSTPAAGKKGYAILVWTGSGSGTSVISAFDNPSVIYNGASSLGTMTGRCTGITETAIGGVATLTVTSTDNTAWYYDVGVGILTQIVPTAISPALRRRSPARSPISTASPASRPPTAAFTPRTLTASPHGQRIASTLRTPTRMEASRSSGIKTS
jgi:hypothetical protein